MINIQDTNTHSAKGLLNTDSALELNSQQNSESNKRSRRNATQLQTLQPSRGVNQSQENLHLPLIKERDAPGSVSNKNKKSFA